MKKFLKKLLAPIISNIVFFWVVFILLLIPNITTYIYTLKLWPAVKLLPSFFTSFLHLLIISYFLCVLDVLMNRLNIKLYKFYNIIIHIIVYCVSFFEVCAIFLCSVQYESFLFQLIAQTNYNEANEFFRTYIFSYKYIIILLCYLVIALFEKYSPLFFNKFNKLYQIFKTLVFSFIGVTCIFFIIFLFQPAFTNVNKLFKDQRIEIIKQDSYFRLFRAIKEFNSTNNEIEYAVLSNANVEIESCSNKLKNIILIIGESFNKYHSSLYGYYLNTNPLLSERKNLLAYNNVITPINITAYSFKTFMSFKSMDVDSVLWCDTPLFPSIFKKANYNVVFYSNQFVESTYSDNVSFIGGHFINKKEINEACFNHRNNSTFRYDGDMVDDYKLKQKIIEKDSLNLVFLHLHGQHFVYESRYTEDFKRFTIDDIKRDDLNNEQKKQVAFYANATLYNDYVVNNIINLYEDKDALIIYFADHGEEIYDFRDYMGRAHDIELCNPNIFHTQFDIPFLIYPTNLYIQNNPEIVNKLKEVVDYPFMIDDLPHLLLDLAGIETKWFDPTRSLINPLYNKNRKRLVGRDKLYDYDEICSVKN